MPLALTLTILIKSDASMILFVDDVGLFSESTRNGHPVKKFWLAVYSECFLCCGFILSNWVCAVQILIIFYISGFCDLFRGIKFAVVLFNE